MQPVLGWSEVTTERRLAYVGVVLLFVAIMAAYEARFRWLESECRAGFQHACHLLRVNGRGEP